MTQRFLYSPFTKAFYRAYSNEEEGIYSCLDNMGGVVSARKAQYFEPKYESKPSARVAPGRTIAGREPLSLFEPKGPHFHKEPVVDKSWNSVPVGQSLPGYYSQPC